MAVYTPLTRTELSEILQQYAIPELMAYAPIERGNTNTSYRVETPEGGYVLTVFETKTRAEVRDLARLMRWLQDHDFATSPVCATTTGQLVGTFGGKPLLLKEWVPGAYIEDLSAGQLAQVGGALAALHRIPVPDYLPTGYGFGLASFSAVSGQGIDPAYEAWLRGQEVRIREQIPAGLPTGLVHGDLFYDNALFAAGQLQAIIDFEVASQDYLVFDIGMTAVGCCRRNGRVDLAKVRALVAGYERVRPLVAAERASLPLFIEYAATATSRWRFWKYHIDAPNPARQAEKWEMVELARAVRGIARTEFWERVFPTAQRFRK
jgi:homoserine kinase type II